MYKLEDNRLRRAKTSDWLNGTPISNFPIYLQELPVEDRQALGWYTHVDYSTELTEATMSGGFDFTGAPAGYMFNSTFNGCSNLTGSIPSGLFGNISGAPADSMFNSTFNGCSNLTGSIPSGLFGNISGAPAGNMFRSTFVNCSNLTDSIPVGLFGNISGAPADYMFFGTFRNCVKLTGESALMPDGVMYLYEQFSTASGTQCDNCYLGATGLDDYDDIPAAWK